MLLDDFDKRRFAYDLHLKYDRISWADGEQRLNELLPEFDQYQASRARGETIVHALVQRVILEHLEHKRFYAELHRPDGATSPQLSTLPGWSLRRRWGHLQQTNPTESTLRWKSLKAANLISFDLPGTTSKDIHATWRIARTLDRYRPTATGIRISDPSYDFKAHTRLANEVGAQVSEPIGWDGRGQFLERATDSHRIYRDLRFIQTWAGIVRAVMAQLDAITSDPMVMGALPFNVTLVGLPDAELVANMIDAVTTGTESLDAIREQVIFPRRN